ncbi:aspartate aminotransferase [Paenibacillus forsythiae]|uniref:Aminotransferase n=1 Tax=Paenibacillus forsythiae TaxID=365616 RepID=A0ABU3HAC7_9BACL|nr:pyridoxal phosphate-dependent aminotransferase [Paenibacillus forsythiae]MDT3427670.1 aspartate aminotransferase [Paenibacillus forsythiae]
MIKRLSNRASIISPSATMSLNAKTKALIKSGKNIINMSVGEPDLRPPMSASLAGIQAIVNGQTGYTPASGLIELREAIAQYLVEKTGISYEPTQIVASAGGKQPLYNTFQVICDEGDEVILPSPYWVSYPEQIKLAGATPVIVRCDETTDFKMGPEQLAQHISGRTKAVIITSPNNPTGSVYSREELKEIGLVLKDRPGIYIICDEIYDRFVYEGEHVSLVSLFPELSDRIILTNGFSKVFAMTGWRLGYTASSLDIAEAISSFQSHATGSPSTISQIAGIAAFDSFDESMVAEYRNRRDLLLSGLNKIEGIECSVPQGAFYAFPKVSNFIGSEFQGKQISDINQFCDLLLEDQLISVVPGSAFGEPNNIRLNFAVSTELILEAIQRIRNFTEKLNFLETKSRRL